MSASIKLTVIRKAVNEALESIDCKMARGSFEFDKETGEVKFVAQSVGVETKPTTTNVESDDPAKDKFLNLVAKNELDKKVRRWYNRNMTDTAGNKWIISAISNKGDKFVLTPKDGEGRNKRVDFSLVEETIAAGRGAKIELGTKPKASPKPATPTDDTDSVKLELENKLMNADKDILLEVMGAGIEAGILDEENAPTRLGVKSLTKFIMTAVKLTGRNSLASIVKKFVKDAPKAGAQPATTSDLPAKVEEELTSKHKRSFGKDKKAFQEALDVKLPAKAKFLAKMTTRGGVRYLVGFNLEKEMLRAYDPENGTVKRIKLTAAKFA